MFFASIFIRCYRLQWKWLIDGYFPCCVVITRSAGNSAAIVEIERDTSNRVNANKIAAEAMSEITSWSAQNT